VREPLSDIRHTEAVSRDGVDTTAKNIRHEGGDHTAVENDRARPVPDRWDIHPRHIFWGRKNPKGAQGAFFFYFLKIKCEKK
jgi:hypothetical protein